MRDHNGQPLFGVAKQRKLYGKALRLAVPEIDR
jgi:hypothetical protein